MSGPSASTFIRPAQKELPDSECFDGEVLELEYDYGKVKLLGRGQPQERIFERDFLDAAGVTGVGDLVKIEFSCAQKTSRGVEVKMHVWKCGKKEPASNPKELITDKLIKEVREKLG